MHTLTDALIDDVSYIVKQNINITSIGIISFFFAIILYFHIWYACVPNVSCEKLIIGFILRIYEMLSNNCIKSTYNQLSKLIYPGVLAEA